MQRTNGYTGVRVIREGDELCFHPQSQGASTTCEAALVLFLPHLHSFRNSCKQTNNHSKGAFRYLTLQIQSQAHNSFVLNFRTRIRFALPIITHLLTMELDSWTVFFNAFSVYFIVRMCLLIYKKCYSQYQLFKKMGVPGPRPLPFVGNFHTRLDGPVSDTDIKWNRKYGRIYGFYDGSRPILSVSDPRVYKKILIKDFNVFTDRFEPPKHETLKNTLFFLPGQKWKRVRTICTPTFTSSKLKNIFSIIRDCMPGVMENLEAASEERSDVDCKKLFGAYALDVIARSAFAANIDTHRDPNNSFATNLSKFFTISYWRSILILLLPSVASYFQVIFTTPDSIEFFGTVVRKLIQERKQNPGDYNDLLQHLIDAEFDQKQMNHMIDKDEKMEDVREVEGSDRKLSEFEISCQTFIFLLAGFETTSSLITQAIYLLSLYRECQDKLYAEIQKVTGGDTEVEVDYETLHGMPYLDAVISETLRLYSPLFRLDRTASADYFEEETGIKIPKGVSISVPIWAVHMDPEFYPEPQVFRPERFLPENKSQLVPYTWLPFGIGPRNCIGMRMALLEARFAILQMVRAYQFFPTAQTDVPLQVPKLTALFTARRVCVGVSKRV